MKWLIHIALVLFALPAAGQQPALLSIEGLGGEHEDLVFPFVSKTADGGSIVHLDVNSQTGNINTTCTVGGSRFVFNNYNTDGSVLQWQDCIPWGLTDSNFYYRFDLSTGETIWGGATTLEGGRDFLIQKEDAFGGIVWTKKYGGSSPELLRDMIATDDNCYIMYGISYSDDGDVGLHYGGAFSSDLWAIKIDSGGNKLWSVVVGGSNDEGARALVQAPGGGCYLYAGTGSWDYDCTTYHGAGDALIARIAGDGSIIWTKCYGGTDIDGVNGNITEDGSGGALVVSASYSNDGDVHNHTGEMDFWLFRIDSNNAIIWDNCFGGSNNNEMPYAICTASDGSIWLGGSSGSNDGHVSVAYGLGDAWIVHVDNGGNYLSSRVLGTSNEDEITTLQALDNGMVMAGGSYSASGVTGSGLPASWNGANDIFLARFAPWTTYVEETKINDEIKIYPNPITDKLFVSMQLGNDATISICNMFGNEVLRSEKPNLEAGIDVSAWPRGIYYLRVTSRDSEIYTRKIILV